MTIKHDLKTMKARLNGLCKGTMDSNPTEISAHVTTVITSMNGCLDLIQRDGLRDTARALIQYVDAVRFALSEFLRKSGESVPDLKQEVAEQLGAESPVVSYTADQADPSALFNKSLQFWVPIVGEHEAIIMAQNEAIARGQAMIDAVEAARPKPVPLKKLDGYLAGDEP
ncbi:MAG: hypothetical protein LBQ75_02715 [Zoogloeaceae bacterium]|jgi:hypothetical protein|nr:hypothetical protein [Zoogloeaceae bacterium]